MDEVREDQAGRRMLRRKLLLTEEFSSWVIKIHLQRETLEKHSQRETDGCCFQKQRKEKASRSMGGNWH